MQPARLSNQAVQSNQRHPSFSNAPPGRTSPPSAMPSQQGETPPAQETRTTLTTDNPENTNVNPIYQEPQARFQSPPPNENRRRASTVPDQTGRRPSLLDRMIRSLTRSEADQGEEGTSSQTSSPRSQASSPRAHSFFSRSQASSPQTCTVPRQFEAQQLGEVELHQRLTQRKYALRQEIEKKTRESEAMHRQCIELEEDQIYQQLLHSERSARQQFQPPPASQNEGRHPLSTLQLEGRRRPSLFSPRNRKGSTAQGDEGSSSQLSSPRSQTSSPRLQATSPRLQHRTDTAEFRKQLCESEFELVKIIETLAEELNQVEEELLIVEQEQQDRQQVHREEEEAYLKLDLTLELMHQEIAARQELARLEEEARQALRHLEWNERNQWEIIPID